MNFNQPKGQPAYGDWLIRTMSFCGLSTEEFAQSLAVSDSAVYRWRNKNPARREMPSKSNQKLIDFTLKPLWPRGEDGYFLPLPEPLPDLASDLDRRLLAAGCRLSKEERQVTNDFLASDEQHLEVMEELKKINAGIEALTAAILK
jgi:hypothetical protein